MNTLFFMVLQNAGGALILALLVWCVTWTWKSPPVAHVLWLLVLVKLVAPPLVSLDLPWWASWPAATGKDQAAEVSVAAAPLMAVSERLPFSGAKDIPNSRIEPVRESVAADQSLSANSTDLSDTVHAAWSAIRPVLIWIWVGGIGLFTIVATTRIVRFHCLLNGTLPGSQRLQRVTRQLASRMGLTHVPEIRLVDSVSSPLVWCLGLRPKIVLPLRLIAALDEQQVAMILAHELAHLRRRDHWIRIIELVATVLHWWNPMVWLVRRRLHQVEEQCCDAWVSWLYPDRVHGYAESLLKVAELLPARSPVPLLASAFLNPPTLKERIEVLLNSGFQRSVSRSMALCLALLAAVVIPAGVQSSQAQRDGAEIKGAEKAAAPAAVAAAQAEEAGKKPATFQMTGTVTLAVTGEPIPGAKITVIVAGQNPDGTLRTREAATDAQGRYTVELPAGHSRAHGLYCPPGYWREIAGIEDFVTSIEKPVFRKDYVVRRGPAWRVRAASASSETPPAGFHVTTIKENAYTVAELDASGHGQITIPGSPGECQLQVFDWKRQFEAIQPATLKYDAGFRSDEVTEHAVDPRGPAHRLTDKQGKTATLTGARVTVEKGVATIEFDARPQDPKKLGKVIGVIIDDAGAPVEGAAVGIAMGTRNGGSAMTSLRATSDATGRFAVERVPIAKGKSDNTVLIAFVTKEEYGGLDTPRFDLPVDAETPLDVGQIRLGKGHSIRLRVVGPQDEPLIGAMVNPIGYAASTQAATTDEKGECEIRNLKKGVQQIDARHGNLLAQTKLVVGEPSAQATLYLKPFNPPAQPVAATKKLEPVQPGDSAPEWKVAAWSDGRSRKLGDFRGKVVVLDFWGTWCGPCLQLIPTMKELEKKYKGQGVVFLSIHTAGTPIKQVQELMRQLEWDVPAGLDEGEDLNGGTTVQRYGVNSFPGFVVIDRAGKVHFNDRALGPEAGVKRMKEAAAALSIPFPNEETPVEEALKIQSRIFGRLYSDAIDTALVAR
jgi:beta-lactamase regulating signal transducer with metallopeptidase domain/thiol-disulfide isomerase/thioredoxin